MTSSANTPLISINAPYGDLEIRGPSSPPSGLMYGIDMTATGILRIASTPTPISSAHITDLDGHREEWDPDLERGPLFFEETTYHLYAAGADHPPTIHHRDPLFLSELSAHRNQRVCAGTFNFGRQVGEAELEVRFGPHVLHLAVEVVPTKIDYATDYKQLRADVEAAARGLALAYMRTTYQGAALTKQPSTEIDWLTILRQESERLQRAIERVNRYPHRELTRTIQNQLARKLRRPDSVARRAIMRGKGSGPVDLAARIGPVRSSLPSTAALSSLDTPEHRWLAIQLSGVRHRLQAISAALALEEGSAHSQSTGLRRQAERDEVDEMLHRINQMLDTECIQAASRPPLPSPPSLTLLTAIGYRESHEILTMLRLALGLKGDSLQLQSKDVHELYEIWSFLEVLRIVAAATGAEIDPASLIHRYSNGLRIGIRAGSLSSINLAAGDRLLTLSYNRTFPGQTGDQKPDIVLRIQEHGHADLIIVLDAKYRVDATDSFRKRYGAPGPPIDAINALHRYRDAIVTGINTPDALRPVVRGAALFPLTTQESDRYRNSSLYRSLDSLGIGALPFLPGNTAMAEQWLSQMLSLHTRELAWNGPPGPQDKLILTKIM